MVSRNNDSGVFEMLRAVFELFSLLQATKSSQIYIFFLANEPLITSIKDYSCQYSSFLSIPVFFSNFVYNVCFFFFLLVF